MLLPPGALVHPPGAGWYLLARQLKQGLRVIFQGNQKQARKSCWGKACHQLHAPEEKREPWESLPAPSSPTCPMLCPSLLHTRGQKHVFQYAVSFQPARAKPYFSLSPSSTKQTPQSSHSRSTGHTAPAPSSTEHSLWPCSRGSHTQVNGCCALFQVSIFSWGRRTFIIQQNTPRCHAPLTRKCCYTVWSQCWRRCHIMSLLRCFLLPCSLNMQNYAYATSFLLAASLECVSCSSLELQRLAASSFSCHFCALPWHSVKSQSARRNRVAFVSSVFSGLPSPGIPPAAHWKMHILPAVPAAS